MPASRSAAAGGQLPGDARRRFRHTSRALQKSWVASNAPSVEAITEFTVDTNGFKAEYGHAGGGVMTFVTKSGTNQFHGSAYEFLRNNDFDANDWFSNKLGTAAADLQAERFRLHRRRPGLDSQDLSRPEQDVLLLLARRVPQSQRRDQCDRHRAYAGNVQRRFQQVGDVNGQRRFRSTIRPRR